MQSVSIKSTDDHYVVEIERATLRRGAAILEEDDLPVAVLLPIGEYQAFQKWQSEQSNATPPIPVEFAREIDAFEQLRPDLQKRYGGQVVAIHQGQVVASGSDKMTVFGQVLDELGTVPCYIEWVEAESPRRVRVPSAWVKR